MKRSTDERMKDVIQVCAENAAWMLLTQGTWHHAEAETARGIVMTIVCRNARQMGCEDREIDEILWGTEKLIYDEDGIDVCLTCEGMNVSGPIIPRGRREDIVKISVLLASHYLINQDHWHHAPAQFGVDVIMSMTARTAAGFGCDMADLRALTMRVWDEVERNGMDPRIVGKVNVFTNGLPDMGLGSIPLLPPPPG